VRMQITVGKNLYQVELEPSDGGYEVTVNGKPFKVKATPEGFFIGGKLYSVSVGTNHGGAVKAEVNGKGFEALILDVAKATVKKSEEAPIVKPSAPVTGGRGGKVLAAPMPGKIVKVLVALNQTVKAGDVVLILEAMKMENEIRSPFAGKVKEIRVSAGTGVAAEEPLILMD